MSRSLPLSLSLSLSLSISICLTISLSLSLFLPLSLFLSLYLSIYISIHHPYMSLYLSVSCSLSLSLSLSFYRPMKGMILYTCMYSMYLCPPPAPSPPGHRGVRLGRRPGRSEAVPGADGAQQAPRCQQSRLCQETFHNDSRTQTRVILHRVSLSQRKKHCLDKVRMILHHMAPPGRCLVASCWLPVAGCLACTAHPSGAPVRSLGTRNAPV